MTTADSTPQIPNRLPPFVYVPCSAPVADIKDLVPASRPLAAGGTGLIYYTALDRLRRACGADATWVVLPMPALAELQERLAFDAFLADDGLPEQERAHD